MFEAMGIGAISFGVIILRKRQGENWFHGMTRSTEGLQQGGGSQVRRWFDGRTMLARAGKNLMLEKPRFAAAAELSGRPTPIDKANCGLTGGVLRQVDGWPEAMRVEAMPLAVMCGCDGRTELRKVIAQVAAAHRVNPQGLERTMLPMIIRWLETGYLS